VNPQNPVKAYKPISRPIVGTGIAATVVIGAGAFVLSFSALTDLAIRAGINSTIAWMWPLIVDGMIVAATVAIVALAGRQGKEQFYPWALLFFGAVVSTAGNSVHAVLAVRAENGNVPVIVSALVAAMPPVVLLAITHLTVLLVQYARHSADMTAALASDADSAPADVDTEDAAPAPISEGAADAVAAATPAARAAADKTADAVIVPGAEPSVAALSAGPAAQTAAGSVDEPAARPAAKSAPRAPRKTATTAQPTTVGDEAAKPKPVPKRKPRKPAATAGAATTGGVTTGAVTTGAAGTSPVATTTATAATTGTPAIAGPAAAAPRPDGEDSQNTTDQNTTDQNTTDQNTLDQEARELLSAGV
jgi:hypothetical protein